MNLKSTAVLVLLFTASTCARGTAQIVGAPCGPECGGCCDASGVCVEGNSTLACGLDGVACQACSDGCFDGVCLGGSGGGTGGSGGGGGLGAGGSGSGGGTGGGTEIPDAGSQVCPPDGWCLESPAPDGTRITQQHLRGVFAVSPIDVWAVGDRGTALHFDGQTWTLTTTPGIDDLFAVWGFASNDVWACGGSGWPTGPVGVVFHWDGNAWSEKLRGTQRLESLWGSGPADLWAMGYGGEMQHFNGTAWSGLTKVTTEAITAIHGRSPTKAWAVGSTGLVMSWNGSVWSVIPNGMFSGLAAVFAFSDTQVWALGGNGAGQTFNGTTWQTVDFGTDNTVLGFWGTSPSEAWGVGPDTLLRFGTASPSRKVAPTTDLLLDVHGADPHNLWAVGFKGTIMRYRR